MTINVPLLRKTMEHIENNPDEWRQDCWATKTDCGTAYCFAGWAAVLSGHAFTWPDGYPNSCFLTDGKHVEEVAEDLLGLTGQQAESLFHAENTLDGLRWRVDHLIDLAENEGA